MHEKLEALKPLLKAGEYAKAEEALKAYRDEFPDDWDGKLMEGLVAQLRGDEKTFRRIHDEAQIAIAKHDDQAAQIHASPLWKKYHKAWGCIAEAVIICLVMAVTGTAGLACIYRPVNLRVRWVWKVIQYGQPAANAWLEQETRIFYESPRDLYWADEDIDRMD